MAEAMKQLLAMPCSPLGTGVELAAASESILAPVLGSAGTLAGAVE